MTLYPPAAPPVSLESHFRRFRDGIVGIDQRFPSPCGAQRIVYADWTASGRLYRPIEERLLETFGPLVGNTHSESSVTGTSMTAAYHEAKRIIKAHVGADEDDILITTGFGMTAAVNKLQRMLGLRVSERHRARLALAPEERPVVLVTHMEHHSNHTSWLETIADVECVQPNAEGLPDLEDLERRLQHHRGRPMLIGAFTACSNVSGIRTPYRDMARLMHRFGGVCFVDFAASAPYDAIDMHPADPEERLDAIFFSPHKFLGGPGTSGVLVFSSRLYDNRVPDQPGGGTVAWTNPWGEYRFVDNVEDREDGGTPGFLQAIKTALCIRLKEEMGTERMHRRETELARRAMAGLRSIPGVHVLADNIEERLGIFSFYTEDVHYNLMVKLLNDRFGVQVRGGCSCAGTYGHYLLHVEPSRSKRITDRIDRGDLSEKPGWVRLSLHPTTTDEELEYALGAIREVVANAECWMEEYEYSSGTNEFSHREGCYPQPEVVRGWFGEVSEG